MFDLKRRSFITLLGGAAATWPLAARAQQPAMPVIGFLRSTSLAPFESLVHAFRQGLEETGFFEGQNIAVEYRYADDQEERLPVLVAELFRRPVSVIVANQAAASVAGSPAAFTGAVTELSSIKRLTIKHTVYVAAVVYRNKQTADQRSDANSEEVLDFPKSNSPLPSLSQASPMPSALCDPFAAGRLGGGRWDSAATVHGAGSAMAAVARTGSGGDPGLGCVSIMAAGGWGDCYPGHSSPKFWTALTNRQFVP